MVMNEDQKNIQKSKVLIVDDSFMNRELLSDILYDDYIIIEAEDGDQALEILSKKRKEIECVLLDISMKHVSGFEVLDTMGKMQWLDTLPVIIISSETSPEFIKKGYNLGAVDYINRPFDADVVKRRVKNTIGLYTNQKVLAKMVVQKIHENERSNTMMIEILGHIVEFRNKESGNHINNVSIITKLLLEELRKRTGKYNLTKNSISMISLVSALHDIGKISIPSEVLNKPGKLTPEEFETMKQHSLIGAQMLESLQKYKHEPIVKTAYKICRWHHERYDGNGYPDKLVGDAIPIEAQVVSLADVYDALTSERCYKRAMSHEKAIELIFTNKCGVFNPLLLECFKSLSKNLPNIMNEINNNKEDLNSLITF